MKKAIIASLLAFSFSATAESFVKRACYAGCTFDGIQAAERACNTVAQGINILSNARVQLVASCRQDKAGTYCPSNGMCTFGDMVLETTFTVH